MTATPISILMEAAERGLKLGFKQPYTLTVEFAKPCLKDFLETLQEYKRQLLTLLQLPFCMVYSKVLKETIVFAEDEDAKATLVEAGAKPGSIYTRAELAVLVEAQVSQDELRKLHEAKQIFNGTITLPSEDELRLLHAAKQSFNRKDRAP